jgi:hypothetical protein
MANKQNQKNLREIYDLLDKLCRKFSPDKHKEVLKKVTTGIVDSQNVFFSSTHSDESIIMAKLKNQIASKSPGNLATFLNLHEELSTLSQPKFRTAILTFLLCLGDVESSATAKFSNTIESNPAGFTLPLRSQIQTSASMEQIFRNSTSRVSCRTSFAVNLYTATIYCQINQIKIISVPFPLCFSIFRMRQ